MPECECVSLHVCVCVDAFTIADYPLYLLSPQEKISDMGLICLSDTAILLSIPKVVYALIWPFKYTYIHSVITLVGQENITRPSSIDISLLWLHKLGVCVCLRNQACHCFVSGYFQWPHRESHQPYLLLWAGFWGLGRPPDTLAPPPLASGYTFEYLNIIFEHSFEYNM